MQFQSRWVGMLAKPAIVAGVVGIFSFFGLSNRIAEFSANLGDKDRIVRWSAVLSGATRDAIPVTLIDVDAATMTTLGNPARVPRDLLAGLLSLSEAKGAGGIFLDMDTSRPGEAGADTKLADFIVGYPPDAPPVALARRVETSAQPGGGAEALVPSSSIFDEAAKGKDNVLWAASVSRVDGDRMVRRWELSHTFCAGAGGQTLPSPPLFAAALVSDSTHPLADLDRYLQFRTREACEGASAPPPSWPRNPVQSAAIAFLIPGSPDPAPQFVRHGGKSVPLFRRVSARTLMTPAGTVVAPRAVADDLLRERFVIIGASHAESMDGHLTPIGYLPGAFVVANAVATAPAVLSGIPIGPIGITLIALGLFGVMKAITSRLRPLAAGIVVALAVLGSLMALGRIFAPSTAGDIVLAAFGMLAFFSTLESLYSIGREWRVRGWRALLKTEKPQRARGTEDSA